MENDVLQFTKKCLLCKVCKNSFGYEEEHPHILPCLATVCARCLQNLNQDDRVICPCCSEKITFPNIFPKDYSVKDARVLVQLCEKTLPKKCEMCGGNSPVSQRCKQCEIYICKDCVSIHKRVRKLTHHELFEITENKMEILSSNNLEILSAEIQCSEHDNEILKIFCPSCRKPICCECAVVLHNGHSLTPLSKAFDEEKGKAMVLCSQVETVIAEIENTIDNLKKEKAKISNYAIDRWSATEETFTYADDILNKKEKELEGAVDELVHQKTKVLNSQTKSVQLLKDFCNEACLFSEHSLMNNNKAALLEISQSILLRLHELASTCFDRSSHTTAQSFRFIGSQIMLRFQEAVNLLATVTNTEANTNGYQVSCPTHCLLHQTCKISIHKMFTQGPMSSHEKVLFSILKDEKVIKETYLLFPSGCKSVDLNWECSGTGMFKWVLHGDGREIADGLICVEEKGMSKEDEVQTAKNDSMKPFVVLCMRIAPKNGELACSFLHHHSRDPPYMFSSQLMNLAQVSYQDGSLSILYDENEDVVAFGNEAEKKYAAFVKDGQTNYRVHRIPKDFFQNANKVIDPGLEEAILKLIFGYVKHFKMSIGLDIGVIPRLAVVLILPRFLRHIQKSIVCNKIGISSSDLEIIDEIDAIVCLGQFLTPCFGVLENKPWYRHFSPGCRYMFLNCEVISQLTVVQTDHDCKQRILLHESTYGTGYVNESVFNVIKEIFGDDVTESYRSKDRHEYLCFMETIQWNAIRYKPTGKANLHIDPGITFKYREMKSRPFTMDDVKNSLFTKYIKCQVGRYLLDIGFILEDTCQKIIEHTKQKLIDYKTNTIILYGYLANSDYFVSHMTKCLPDIRILVPKNSNNAVLAGGVKYGFECM